MPTRYSIVGQTKRGLDSHLTGTLPGTAVTLVREPDNKFDANAIMVWIDGKHVGYVPAKNNAALAQFIDASGAAWLEPQPNGAVADSATVRRAIEAKFVRSPNSAYPQVEV